MRNGDEVREHVLARARRHAQETGLKGMTEDEISASFDGQLNEIERDFLRLLARHEADRGPYSRKYMRASGT